MDVGHSLIAELDDAIQRGSSDKRIATLRRVTDLFLSNAGRYEPGQLALFDDVLVRMIEHIESKALAELGQRLAPVDGAPIEVIRRLANHDEIAVAGPVLKDSKQLSGPDLVDIARSKGQGHLLAISQRAEIDEAVTDVLVDRGDTEVARSVAVNAGARLSQAGFATLVKRAKQDDQLTELVGRRADMPPKMFEQLLAQATEAVKERLLASLKPEAAGDIAQTLNKVTRDLNTGGAKRDYTEAQHLIKLMKQDGKLSEATVLEFARANRIEETLVALAQLCATPLEVVDRLMNGNRVDALLIPCKAAELSWPTAKAMIRLHPIHGLASEETFEAARKDYLKLSVSAAQRILRFWQVRSSVNPAVPATRLSA
jgi:uncharacterized protein (DUF2336 family)